jgi:betaine lipid synthase
MDHMDWFDEGSEEANEEVRLFFDRLQEGGILFWRSASREPWYAEVFRQQGFVVDRISVRESGKPCDRVNM